MTVTGISADTRALRQHGEKAVPIAVGDTEAAESERIQRGALARHARAGVREARLTHAAHGLVSEAPVRIREPAHRVAEDCLERGCAIADLPLLLEWREGRERRMRERVCTDLHHASA